MYENPHIQNVFLCCAVQLQEVGRINYVPITAVQRFDMEKKFIRNGVPLALGD